MPTVSVVVVVRNEEQNIARCLSQLLNQDYPRDRFEIIVADGMSTDKTREIAESFRGDCVPLRIVLNPGRGRAQGLNVAIRAAKGEAIARIDARTVIGPDYLSRCVRTLLDTGADNVGGVQKPIARSLTQEAIGLALSHPFGVGNAQFRLGTKSGYVDTVYLGCFRREVFNKVGYFDEDASVISEDSDLNQRIQKAGGKVYLNTDIVAHYYPRETFHELWNLYFRYGGARAGNFLKHRTFTSWRQAIPPLFVGTLAGLAASAFFSPLFLLALLGLVGSYLTLDAIVSVQLALEHGKFGLFPRLMLAFPCVHIGWALGFWKHLLVRDRPGTYWGG